MIRDTIRQRIKQRALIVICAMLVLSVGCSSNTSLKTDMSSQSTVEKIPDAKATAEAAADRYETNEEEPDGQATDIEIDEKNVEIGMTEAIMPEEYKEILDTLYEFLDQYGKEDSDNDRDVGGGVMECAMDSKDELPLNDIGYTLMDLDQNGTDELIITEENNQFAIPSRILRLYTLDEDLAVLLVDGWYRNRWFVLSDHRLFNEGSGGAAYSVFGVYHLNETDGISLTLDEHYFSDFADINDPDSWGWYTNMTEQCNKDQSEPVTVSNDEISALRDSYEADVVELPSAEMADYPYEGPVELTKELIIRHYQRAVKRAGKMENELEKGDLSQLDMNFLSADIYHVWDGFLNELWQYLVKSLPEDEMAALKAEQIQWIAEKEAAVEDAGKEYEGGSIRPLIENTEATDITKKRIDVLMEYLG